MALLPTRPTSSRLGLPLHRFPAVVAGPLMAAGLTAGAGAAPLTYFVDEGTFNGDTGRYNAAVAAMQNVVDRHNAYGDFGGYNVYVYYNAGIPTAQASYLGSIGLGGTYPNDRVTQHELNHYLGSGTLNEWYGNFDQYGGWTGANVSKLVQQFNGDGARIYQAGVHYYDYGLNYDTEVTNDATYMRNVAIMYAMRQDMGLHTANPWSATNVTLTASDPVGTSAFNWFGGGFSGSYPGWSDNYFPHSGAAYSTGAFSIRTPQGYPGWTFGGDSLTVNAGGQLLFNGWGTDNAVTINNLILSGGTVKHDQNPQDHFQLAGNVSLAASSTIQAANGPITVLAPISGSGGLTTIGPYPVTLSAINSHSGGTTAGSGTLALANGGGAGSVRGSLAIGSGARVELDAVDALGYDSGTSVTQVTINGGTLDNAVAGNNGARANWTLTGGNMTSSGGGSFHIGYQGANTITSNASATTSNISGNVVLRSGNSPTVTVADGAATTDLLISGAISQGDGPAGITKAGAGLLALGGANTYTGATTVNAGTLAFRSSPSGIGNVTVANSAGLQVQATGPSSTTLTTTALSLGTGGSTSLGFDFNFQNPSVPLVSTGSFTANGTVNLSFQNGSLLSAGNHTLVSYTSFGGGTFPGSPFAVGPRSTGTVTNNGVNALILNVVGGDRPVWTGLDSTNWIVGATGSNKNWKLQTAGTATDYIETDNVLFNDTPAGTTIDVNIAANVTPAATNFDTTKTYNLASSGGFGIGGPGSLVKSGSGTVNLNTANTFTGSVTVDGGTLFANPGNAANNRAFSYVSDITVNSGTLKAGANGFFGWDGSQVKPITVHSGGTLTIDGTGNDVNVGTVTLDGGTLAGGPSVDWGSWNFGRAAGVNPGSGKLVASENSLVTATNLFFSNGAFIDVASGKTLTISGTITDANSEGVCSLVKSGGTGTLVLSGTNTYSGGSTINAGTVSISDDTHIGANGSAIAIDGGTLQTTAYVFNTHPITIGASGGTINVSTAGQYFFNIYDLLRGSGPLALTGNGTLTENVGNLRLNQTNTYSGALTIRQGGILEYGNVSAIDGAATVTLEDEAEIAVQGAGAVSMPNNLTVTGGTNSVLSFENGDLGSYSGPIQLNADLSVSLRDWYNHGNSHSGTISGAISGTGTLNVNSGNGSAATLTLTGNNPFTGDISVTNATLAAGTYNQGDTLAELATNLGNLATTRTITLHDGGTLLLTDGNVLGTGASPSALAGLTLAIETGGAFQTGLNGAGSGWWNKMGDIALNGGTVRVGSGANDTNFQGLALVGDVTVGGTSASTIAPLAASSATTNGVHLGQNADAGQVVTFDVADVTANANTDLTVSARLLNTSAALNSSGLAKSGSGTMELSGVSSYTGPTSLNAGITVVSGSLGNTAVSVAPGATLGGNGDLGGNVTIGAGAHHALAVAATPGAQDTRLIGGNLDLSAVGDILDLTAAAEPALGDYTLVTATGGITGGAGDTVVNLTGIPNGSVAVVGNSLILTVSPASAYSAWALAKELTGLNNGAEQDPDFDGIANVLEFVLGGDPLASDTHILPSPDTNATNFIYTFSRADESEDEVDLTFEYSPTMATGTWTQVTIGENGAPSGPEVAIAENDAAPDTITITVPKGANLRLFGRLKAVK